MNEISVETQGHTVARVVEQLEELQAQRLLENSIEDVSPAPSEIEAGQNGWAYILRGVSHEASGPLQGLRLAVKGTLRVKGVPLASGNENISAVSNNTAEVVRRALKCGAELAGTTSTTNLDTDGAGFTSWPIQPLEHPTEPGMLPGGSSSGNAIVLVRGEADIAIGADAGGSIREPASWSGCVGLKPSRGLVPSSGYAIPGFSHSLYLGPMAMTVRSVANLLSVMADGGADYTSNLDERIEGITVGVLQEGFAIPGVSDPEVDYVTEAAIQKLVTLGAKVIEVSAPLHRYGARIRDALTIEHEALIWKSLAQLPVNLGDELKEFTELARDRREEVPLPIRSSMAVRDFLESNSRSYLGLGWALAQRLETQYDSIFSACDVLMMPTTPFASQSNKLGDLSQVDCLEKLAGGLHNAAPFNVTGHPAISVPCGSTSSGLPVGLQIVGRRLEERMVLRVANAFEDLMSAYSGNGA